MKSQLYGKFLMANDLVQGVLRLKNKAMADDTRPIDPTCDCMVGIHRTARRS